MVEESECIVACFSGTHRESERHDVRVCAWVQYCVHIHELFVDVIVVVDCD